MKHTILLATILMSLAGYASEQYVFGERTDFNQEGKVITCEGDDSEYVYKISTLVSLKPK